MTDITPEIVKRGILPQNRPDQRAPQREEPRPAQRLQRRIKQSTNPLDLPDEFNRRMESLGLVAEWKRYEVAGKEEGYYQADLRANHWEPVNCEDEPDLAPYGQTQGPIKMGALMLMKRPKYLCDEATAETQAMTRRRLKANAERIKDAPPGTFDRGHPKNPSLIRKTNEREALDTYDPLV